MFVVEAVDGEALLARPDTDIARVVEPDQLGQLKSCREITDGQTGSLETDQPPATAG